MGVCFRDTNVWAWKAFLLFPFYSLRLFVALPEMQTLFFPRKKVLAALWGEGLVCLLHSDAKPPTQQTKVISWCFALQVGFDGK